MDTRKDYYKILGVNKNANKTEIKAAYRKLSLQFHPDKNPGDKLAEERMKEINEAKDILLNDITRMAYDEYVAQSEKGDAENETSNNKQSEYPDASSTSTSKGKRTYQKKSTIRKETKIFVKGHFTAKYWAQQEDNNDLFILREILYKITPYEAEATITDTDIHSVEPPLNFQKGYSEAEIFKSPIPQPVKCKVVTEKGDEYYDLHLQEVRIIDPQLSDISKHEKQSLGRISGPFYAYVIRVDEEEIFETVTECFGETGNIETKTENANVYSRKEYYHKDCSTFWGPWELIKKAPIKPKSVNTFEFSGCLNFWWVLLLLLLFAKFPNLFLGLLAFGLLFLFLSLGGALLGRILPILALLLILYALYSAFKSSSSGGEPIPRTKSTTNPSYDTLVTTTDPLPIDTSSHATGPPDSLISHYIRWKDYDSNRFEATLSITTSSLQESFGDIRTMQFNLNSNTLHPVYKYCENVDHPRLKYIFQEFDSIKTKYSLSEQGFAKMVVSCIQSLPYYLVLSNSCTDDNSNDAFIKNYLRNCNRDCCVGFSPYGLRTPVEFMGDLKGDCDTRSLMIYAILKHFNYKVAVMSSTYYQHAVVAVAFNDETGLSGLIKNINDKNYYLWETTDFGFQPGQVPPDNQNLDYWQIALINVNQL